MKSKVANNTILSLLILLTMTVVFVASYQYINRFLLFHSEPSLPVVTEKIPSFVPTGAIKQKQVSFYLVAIGDNGQKGRLIGCGDSLIKVNQNTTTDISLKSTLEGLLAIKTSEYGGFYNSLSLSTISVGTVEMTNGEAKINLIGRYLVNGECDGPRFIEQLKETVNQYPGVNSATITVNGVPLEGIFSLKGQ